jgi:hypothetical protein
VLRDKRASAWRAGGAGMLSRASWDAKQRGVRAQVCGVFALFLSGAHTLLFWGLLCHPRTRAAFICAYYLAAAACVAAGLRGRSAVQARARRPAGYAVGRSIPVS